MYYNGTNCPYCKCEILLGESIEPEGATKAYRDVSCSDCKKRWQEIFTVTGYMDENGTYDSADTTHVMDIQAIIDDNADVDFQAIFDEVISDDSIICLKEYLPDVSDGDFVQKIKDSINWPTSGTKQECYVFIKNQVEKFCGEQLI